MEAIVETFNKDVDTQGKLFCWSFTRGFVTLEMAFGEEQDKPSPSTTTENSSSDNHDNHNDHVVILQMLPIQAMVLLLFQGEERRSFNEIMMELNVTERLLKYVINSLVFSRFQVGLNGKGLRNSC